MIRNAQLLEDAQKEICIYVLSEHIKQSEYVSEQECTEVMRVKNLGDMLLKWHFNCQLWNYSERMNRTSCKPPSCLVFNNSTFPPL